MVEVFNTYEELVDLMEDYIYLGTGVTLDFHWNSENHTLCALGDWPKLGDIGLCCGSELLCFGHPHSTTDSCNIIVNPILLVCPDLCELSYSILPIYNLCYSLIVLSVFRKPENRRLLHDPF